MSRRRYLNPSGTRERALMVKLRRVLPQLTAAMALGRLVSSGAEEEPGRGVGEVVGADSSRYVTEPRVQVRACPRGGGVCLCVRTRHLAAGLT